MARWMPQTIDAPGRVELYLGERHVSLRRTSAHGHSEAIGIEPQTQADAHDLALALRKAARRLEEIGRGLK